jgi:hypothetical protein
MAIDYTTARGQVRLLTSDANEANPILTDDEVNGFLLMRGITGPQQGAQLTTLKRCAADILDAIASSEALTSKVIRTQDLSTDGSKTATALREHADRLRNEAVAEEDAADKAAYGGWFEVAEFHPYPAPLGEATEAAAS